MKHLTHLPVIGDPTHPAGHKAVIPSVSMGIVACGADGLLIEVHEDPKNALTDKRQLLDYEQFESTMGFVNMIVAGTRNLLRTGE